MWLGLRSPGCVSLGNAVLRRYALRFHVPAAAATDHSGKCDAFYTGRAGDAIHGVVLQVQEQYWEKIRAAHREGSGYQERTVRVHLGSEILEAMIFMAEPRCIDEHLLPYHWYLAVIASAARIHGLPAAYQARLRAVPTVVDPDRERAARNLEIARGSRKVRPFLKAPRP